MKYLLQAIDAQRSNVRLSDHELRDLLVEVRSGKDDRIEFTDAMMRLLDELRSSEHATAFLNKVAKRDAPDYYDVIKNPMDLGTMTRNVRSGRYKNKAQFTRDLDLIWDNCLTYNSEPTHPLRRSVQVLRNKANHLLTYVNDTNDVKEALNHWQAGLGLSPQKQHSRKPSVAIFGDDVDTPASAKGFLPSNMPWAEGASFGLNGDRKSIAPTAADAGAAVDGEVDTKAKEGDGARRSSVARPAQASSLVELPFEQKPALLRQAAGMDTFARLDTSLRAADEVFARQYMLYDSVQGAYERSNAEAGPSSKPMLTNGTLEAKDVVPSADLETLRMLETSNKGGVLRAALTTDVDASEDEVSKLVYPMDPTLDEREGAADPGAERADVDDAASAVGAWWNSTTHPTLLGTGMSELARSRQGPAKRPRRIGMRLSKRPKKGAVTNGDGPAAADADTGEAAESLFAHDANIPHNVETIVKLRRMHAKYGSLIGHIESGDPVPADLVVVSSDEEDDNDGAKAEKRKRRSSIRGQRMLDRDANAAGQTRSRRKDKADDVLAVAEEEMLGNPYPKLGSEGAKKLLEHRVQLQFAHAGFEGAQRAASSVATDVAGEFIMNLGNTLKSYVDRFSREMSVEELIMHALFENAGADVASLESYVRDDVQRQGHKMHDLLRKLRTSYRETLTNTDLVMADEVAFFAGSGEGDSNARASRTHANGKTGEGDDDGEQIMRGGLALDVADEDFFGFKDMGLDAELGVDVGRQLAQLPSRMFQRRKQGEAQSKAGKGSNGVGREGRPGADDDVVEFAPPPPYVPLSEAAISAQIGLLQPFYRELMRSRGQWMRDDAGEGDGAIGDESRMDAQMQKQGGDGEPTDEQQEQENDPRQEGAYLVLPDEEQERQRYKVPPTGKMPKRVIAGRREGEDNGRFGGAKSISAKRAAPSLLSGTTKPNGAPASNGKMQPSTPLQSTLSATASTAKSNGRNGAVNGNGNALTTTKKKKSAKAPNHGRTGTPVTVS